MDVRLAVPDDAAALTELRWEFRSSAAECAEDERHFKERCAAWMRARLCGASNWRAWLAAQDGMAIGCVWLQVVEKIANPNGEAESFAYVSNLYVRPAARGGVGSRLLDTCVQWAASRSIEHVVLWPTVRSRTLYQRFGFAAHGDVLLRKEDG